MGCLFCQLQSNKENIIYEDESLYVILDRFPLSNRHLLVIPKNHYEFFHLCPEDIVSAMARKARELVVTLKMEKYNLLQNNGNCQLIRHSHLHIIEANETGRLSLAENTTLKFKDEEYNELVEKVKKLLNA